MAKVRHKLISQCSAQSFCKSPANCEIVSSLYLYIKWIVIAVCIYEVHSVRKVLKRLKQKVASIDAERGTLCIFVYIPLA